MANFYGYNYYNDSIGGTYYADNIYGYSGNDNLWGYGGNDMISGGSGSDYINGGAGGDDLYGGAGYDTFAVFKGQSPSNTWGADYVWDWNGSYDYIDSSITGSYYNYSEASTSATSIEAARAHVEGNYYLRQEDHVFLYNYYQDRGYLLSDLDWNGTFETGVVLVGAGSAWDFTYTDIV